MAVVLAAIFPVLFLWAHNVDDEIPASAVVLVAAECIATAMLTYGLFRALFRDRVRAGLITLVCEAVVLSFGHVASAGTLAPGSSRETVLLVASLVLMVVASWVIAARPRGDAAFRVIIPVLSVLVVINLARVVTGGEVTQPREVPTAATIFPDEQPHPHATGTARDVYYLVFDRYGGERTLRDLYGFDNDPFLANLEDRGFTVVDDTSRELSADHSLARFVAEHGASR